MTERRQRPELTGGETRVRNTLLSPRQTGSQARVRGDINGCEASFEV